MRLCARSSAPGSWAPALVAVALLAIASSALTCHRLAAAKTFGNVGPNLNAERVSHADGIWVISGGLSTMPGFKGTLKQAQIHDVAAFLAKATDG